MAGVPEQCVMCPMLGKEVVRIEAGASHTVVQTLDDELWSFGLNSQGELMRTNINLELSNPNFQPLPIPPTTFGDGLQPLLGVSAALRGTFVQTERPLCSVGNHSVDRRSPCLRCEPGSYTSVTGALTTFRPSPDQSTLHPYSQRNALVPTEEAVLLSCDLCTPGEFSATENSTVCGMCRAGSYSFAGASTCHLCALGTFSPKSGTSNCTLCAAGSTTLHLGQTGQFPPPHTMPL